MAHDIIAAISEPRFRTYLLACEGDADRATALYLANMRLSGAALESLHMFEIVLRNAIDLQLRAWNQKHGGSMNWALHPVPLLRGVIDGRGKLRDAESVARKAVRRHRRPVTHDDVVAQLSLGTWRYLLPSRSDAMKQKLWDEALVNAFPNLYTIAPTVLTEWIAMAYDLRNRVAHFEPIFSRDLYARRRAMYRTIKTVSRGAQSWFGANDRFHRAVEDFYDEWPEHKGSKL
jgi:hypothetical protein